MTFHCTCRKTADACTEQCRADSFRTTLMTSIPRSGCFGYDPTMHPAIPLVGLGSWRPPAVPICLAFSSIPQLRGRKRAHKTTPVLLLWLHAIFTIQDYIVDYTSPISILRHFPPSAVRIHRFRFSSNFRSTKTLTVVSSSQRPSTHRALKHHPLSMESHT